MSAASAGPIAVRIARSPAEAQEAWRDVCARGTPGYHGQTFEWYDAYHRSLGAGGTAWVIAILMRGASPVGVLPLCAQTTRVYKVPVRALALPAHPDLLLCDIAASEPLPIAGLDRALRGALARADVRWDVILLQKVREDSKAAAVLAEHHVAILDGKSSWFSCREGYEAIAANYASRLKKSLKQASKRLRGKNDIEILRTDASHGIAEAFTEFLEVEASGWKAEQGSAIGQVADRRAFYELLTQGGNGVWRPEINLLRLNGRTAAAQLCVRAGRALNVLKIGYDESHRELTPGNLLLDHLLRTSCESGDTDTVSLVTDTAWMADWRPRKAAVLTLMRFNHTAPGLAARALSHVGRLRNRIRKSCSSAASPTPPG
ncbi:MAG: GNAT family N-acetyltransferase [Proteobacteria bacterium]|nr:GNAT family N-acetyltransferase [Pseudomonadota bacterium]